MENVIRMGQDIADKAPGSHRGEASRQGACAAHSRSRLEADQSAFRQVFADILHRVGTADWLATALGREESYGKKISGAINCEKDRKVQTDWFAPMLDDPAIELLIAWLCERCGFEPPVREREVSEEDEARAARECIAEMDEEHREVYRRKMARKLGVRPERVRL